MKKTEPRIGYALLFKIKNIFRQEILTDGDFSIPCKLGVESNLGTKLTTIYDIEDMPDEEDRLRTVAGELYDKKFKTFNSLMLVTIEVRKGQKKDRNAEDRLITPIKIEDFTPELKAQLSKEKKKKDAKRSKEMKEKMKKAPKQIETKITGQELVDLITKNKLLNKKLTFSIDIETDMSTHDINGSCTDFVDIGKNGIVSIVFKDDPNDLALDAYLNQE